MELPVPGLLDEGTRTGYLLLTVFGSRLDVGPDQLIVIVTRDAEVILCFGQADRFACRRCYFF